MSAFVSRLPIVSLELKNTRIKDRKLLDWIKEMPCLACGKYPSDPCHIKTVKSGGPDLAINLLSLCRRHHSEQHQYGFFKFANKYPHVYDELKIKGWYFDEFNKLRNDTLADFLRQQMPEV